MGNTRPRGLRSAKVIKDDDLAASALAKVVAEHPHWMSRIPLMVKDLNLFDIGHDADAVIRALGKIAELAGGDRDFAALFSFVSRLTKKAYAGATVKAVPRGAKDTARIDSVTLGRMADEHERRRSRAKQKRESLPSPRDTVSDPAFRRMFPVIGGTTKTKRSSQVTQDWARKLLTREMGRRAAQSK